MLNPILLPMSETFHLALPCDDLQATQEFYVLLLGGALGRTGKNWLDIDLYGNQLTFTQAGDFNFQYKNYRFEEYVLPSFHFGIVLQEAEWQSLYQKLSKFDLDITSEAVFLGGKTGEHRSFFVQDPSGYMVEFKTYSTQDHLFLSEPN